ncbi:MAG: FkbM family methyltransferase [Anaerolineae bacterium]|jgi:FkbM family methyltransferase|nr:FkbM family methyltransferase [Anaerolineae bacterium]
MRKTILKSAAWAAKQLPSSWKAAIYKVKPLANGIRRILNRAAPEGLTKVYVAAGDLKGTKLYLNMHLEKDYWLGTYEPELQKAVRTMLKPGMVVYDIGANIGYISLLFAKAIGPEGRIFSFEALPANIERLKQNAILSQSATPIQVIHGAVTDKAEPVEFLVHSSTSMGKVAGAAGRDVDYLDKISVPGIALDAYVKEHQLPAPDMIKLDIEGGEVLAVKAMKETLTASHPLLFIELHGPESARAVAELLDETGYTAYHMDKPKQKIDLHHPDHWKAYIIAR